MTPCEGHAALPAELRALLSGALDRIEPVIERIQAQQRSAPAPGGGSAGTAGGPVPTAGRAGTPGGPVPTAGRAGAPDPHGGAGADGAVPPGAAAACGVCPICAVVAVLRGERSELAAKAVDHAAGLLAVLRAALDEGLGASPSAGAPGPSGSAGSAGSAGSGDTHRRPPPQRPPGRPVQRITVRR